VFTWPSGDPDISLSVPAVNTVIGCSVTELSGA